MMKKATILKISSAILAVLAMASCQQKEWTYENKLYISGDKVIKTITNIKVNAVDQDIVASVPKPAESRIDITFAADESLVSTYNEAYYDNAIALPAENYTISEPSAFIAEGAVASTPVTVSCFGLDLLPKDQVYVLPVTIVSATNIEILSSAKTSYLVFQGGALINVAADFEDNNYIEFEAFEKGLSSVDPYKNLTDFTMEALINIRQFEPGIQTVMGVEGKLLIRISDNGLEPNQLQVVTPFGNYPTTSDPSTTCALTPNKWTHIAVTGNAESREVKVYFDGQEVGSDIFSGWSTIDIVTPYQSDKGLQYFHIGYSYEAGREIDGMISECRFWNVTRSQEEIAANMYDVDPKTEGLLGYWKFNEGSGETINDRTGNGVNGTAHSYLVWTPVALPE